MHIVEYIGLDDMVIKEIEEELTREALPLDLTILRKKIVEISEKSQEGHIPSALSILDILAVLYDRVLRFDPCKPECEERDRLILSKGHGSLALYTILAEKGFFATSELETFGRYNSMLGGHPERAKIPGIEVSSGSLGHGFPIAVGMALGLKMKNNTSNKVFVLIGDGEANEGSIWEAALLAAHHSLTNLYCVVDYNHSTDRALRMGDIAAKFAAFGWDTKSINGHSHEEIYQAFIMNTTDKPLAIIANCIKGYGCKIMENNPAWHHRAPSIKESKLILEDMA